MRSAPRYLAALGLALLVGGAIALPLQARRKATPPAVQTRAFRAVTPLSFVPTNQAELWSLPAKEGRFVGSVAPGSRLPILRKAPGRRCQGGWWFEVATNAWICSSQGKPAWRLPDGVPQPVLPKDELVPRKAFYTRRDGVPVYLRKEDAAAGKHDRIVEKGFSFSIAGYSRVGGKGFMRSRNGELVPSDDMYGYTPSDFVGRALAEPPPRPIGCSVGYKTAPVWDRPTSGGRRVDQLKFHTWVEIFEEQVVSKKRYYRIGPDRWVRSDMLRKLHFTDPPAEAGANEKWIEVLLNHQTLVAYEGRRPVYATLVSTGRTEHKSPAGLYRVKTKVSMSAMNNRPGDSELYRVDDVPWIQYFFEGFALHGTYWHDQFGTPKSHGCINLSPKDARWVFEWSPPRLRAGWTTFETYADRPGVLLRVRTSATASAPNRIAKGLSILTPLLKPDKPVAPGKRTRTRSRPRR
jgi:hypothetical protein